MPDDFKSRHPDHAMWPLLDAEGEVIGDIHPWAFCRWCEAEHKVWKAYKQGLLKSMADEMIK